MINRSRQVSAKDYALRLLSIRPRSVREIIDRLARKGYDLQAVDSVVADLAELGLLDDAKFAKLWIESRTALRPMGASRLRAELARKGVARGLIDQALADSSKDRDEEVAAMELASRKLRSLRSLDPAVARRRLAGFLSRRGFSAVLKEMPQKDFSE